MTCLLLRWLGTLSRAITAASHNAAAHDDGVNNGSAHRDLGSRLAHDGCCRRFHLQCLCAHAGDNPPDLDHWQCRPSGSRVPKHQRSHATKRPCKLLTRCKHVLVEWEPTVKTISNTEDTGPESDTGVEDGDEGARRRGGMTAANPQQVPAYEADKMRRVMEQAAKSKPIDAELGPCTKPGPLHPPAHHVQHHLGQRGAHEAVPVHRGVGDAHDHQPRL